METRVTQLLGIRYPVIQAGMIWCSGWKLASAVANAGGLGLLGSGSMYPDVLKEHIRRCKAATGKPFGVNVPLIYPDVEKHIATIIEEKIPIVFTSAGNPKTWTAELKRHGIRVIHVVASSAFAQKAEAAGCDAVVAEGFEAGGHNGREETTTLVLVPAVTAAVKIPVIAAGGIGNGRSMAAAFALGAEAVQVGSRFAATEESSAHPLFKQKIIDTAEGGTQLSLKKLMPVRLIKNQFYETIKSAEDRGAEEEELKSILGRARAKLGMFEGNLEEGELEIGQASCLIHEVLPAAQVLRQMVDEFEAVIASLCDRRA